jgi:hypothetical protein
MGWFGKSPADGCRDAMRAAYKRHRRTAEQAPPEGLLPHWVGLYGALGSRYLTRGGGVNEAQLWVELVPFLLMEPESRAVEALAEYALYQESRNLANVGLLKRALNEAIGDHAVGADEAVITMLDALRTYQPEWLALLDQSSVGVLAILTWQPYRALP